MQCVGNATSALDDDLSLPGARMKSQSSKLALSLQRDALRFAEADADGNLELTFEEFIEMQPAQVREQHGVETLRGWFEAADTDSSGTVSINEFLLWSLTKEQARTGDDSGLRAMFSVYGTSAGEQDLGPLRT